MKEFIRLKRKQLLALPEKPWKEERTYTSLIISSNGRKHDSGWALIAIIGCNHDAEGRRSPYDIAAYCDDINWKGDLSSLRTDMLFPSGLVHMWSGNKMQFRIGYSLSSTDVFVEPRP